MLQIPSHCLKAALTHAGDRDVRSYLNCVRLEVVSSGDLYIVATDGARCFVGRILAGRLGVTLAPFAVSIPRDTIKRALTARTPMLALHLDPLTLGDVAFKQPDGQYPDWRRIVPAAHADESPADFNWAFMADAQAALRTWLGQPGAMVHASIRGANAALVTCSDAHVFAIVMPVRRKADAAPFAPRFEPIR